jgi:hypothetical protein
LFPVVAVGKVVRLTVVGVVIAEVMAMVMVVMVVLGVATVAAGQVEIELVVYLP